MTFSGFFAAGRARSRCVIGAGVVVTRLLGSVTLLPVYRAWCILYRYFPSLLGDGTAANCSLSYKLAPHPKPPLCKGRWLADRRDGGIVAVRCCILATNRCEFITCSSNPSVKNQRFLTAPFTQGSLGRSRASASSSDFHGVTIPSTPQRCYDNCRLS